MKKYSIYFLAHGKYFKENKEVISNSSFTLPENIRLITYSPPTKLLDSIVAENIIKQLNENPLDIPKNVTIYSGFTNGEIYKSEINPIIRKPGNQITNMSLQFTNDIPGFVMNIFVLDNNTKKVIDIKDFDNDVDLRNTDLETVIGIIEKYISSKSSETDDDEIIDVHQLSCHEGNYFDINKATHKLVESAVEDLTNQFDKTLELGETKDTTELFKENPLNETRPRTLIISEDIKRVKKEVEEYEIYKQTQKLKKRTSSNIEVKFFPEKHKQTKRRYNGGNRKNGNRKNSRRKTCSRKNRK